MLLIDNAVSKSSVVSTSVRTEQKSSVSMKVEERTQIIGGCRQYVDIEFIK